MAKVLIEVPDDLINWTEWARRQLANGGLRNTVVEATADVPSATPTADGSAQAAPSAESQDQSDPWTSSGSAQSAPGNQGTASTSAPAVSDGWGAASSPTGSGTTGQQPVEAPAQPIAYGTLVIAGQKGPRTCVFGKQGAPPCNHGQPAVFTEFSSGKKNWACALSATKRWKEKCEFTQWA